MPVITRKDHENYFKTQGYSGEALKLIVQNMGLVRHKSRVEAIKQAANFWLIKYDHIDLNTILIKNQVALLIISDMIRPDKHPAFQALGSRTKGSKDNNAWRAAFAEVLKKTGIKPFFWPIDGVLYFMDNQNPKKEDWIKVKPLVHNYEEICKVGLFICAHTIVRSDLPEEWFSQNPQAWNDLFKKNIYIQCSSCGEPMDLDSDGDAYCSQCEQYMITSRLGR